MNANYKNLTIKTFFQENYTINIIKIFRFKSKNIIDYLKVNMWK